MSNRLNVSDSAAVEISIRTPLQKFLSWVIVIVWATMIVACVVSPFFFRSKINPVTATPLLIGIPLSIVVTYAAIKFHYWIEAEVVCRYIIDKKRQRIIYRRSVFGAVYEEEICSIQDIHSVSVQGIYVTRSRIGSYWVYLSVIILKSGKIIELPIAEEDNSHGFDACKFLVEELSHHLQSKITPCKPRCFLEIIRDDEAGTIKIIHKSEDELSPLLMRMLVKLLIVVFCAALIALLVNEF